MSSSPPGGSNLSKIQGFFRGDKDKISPGLKRALAALQLDNLEDLQEHFLAKEAFLRPWGQFRDSIFLQQADALPHATIVAGEDADGGITRMELLWYYTQFDEGFLRYDPRADQSASEYTPDSSMHGIIDKSNWGIQEHEKLLYAWLLQEFKVGKKTNPWGFVYFQLRSVASAWELVFVPIVDAVRASYNIKGRQHYGRLALFIESRCPSGLAFPENNVNAAEGSILSSMPFRIVSMPKKLVNNRGTTYDHHTTGAPMLTKKHYDETERELRDVYPQYGGLVERPRFKHKMEEWLNEQRMRADRRKLEAEKLEEVGTLQPRVVQRDGSWSPPKIGTPDGKHRKQSSQDSGVSSIKRYSDHLRRSLSFRTPKKAPKEEPKSPLHGVTRQLVFPDKLGLPSTSPRKHVHHSRDESVTSRYDDVEASGTDSIPKPVYRPRKESLTALPIRKTTTPIAQPVASQRKGSEHSVYSKIRDSNPFHEEFPEELGFPRSQPNADNVAFSPMGQMSAIPPPLQYSREYGSTDVKLIEKPAIAKQKFHAEARIPSYEGTGYANEISPTALHESRKSMVHTPGPPQFTKPPTRLPTPIRPAPYTGSLRTASKEVPPVPKAVPWPGSSLPRPVAWPGRASHVSSTETAWPRCELEEESAPPVPRKSPERRNTSYGYVGDPRLQQLGREDSQDMSRIVSIENIRAAVGNISGESSLEDLALPKVPFVETPRRTISPGSGLQTFNKNMFPRKVTPVGSEKAGNNKTYETGGAYEMEVLSKADPSGRSG